MDDPPVSSRRGSALWRLVMFVTIALLAAVAAWLWSGDRSGEPPEVGEPGTEAPGGSRQEDAFAPLELLVAEERFGAARGAAAALAVADPEGAAAFLRRLERREAAFRARLRPVLVQVDWLETTEALEDEPLFAELGAGGQLRWITEALARNFAEAGPERRANRAVVRTTLEQGLTLRIVDGGGLLRAPEPLTAELPLAPLVGDLEGSFEFQDPDGAVRRARVLWSLAPGAPGLSVDDRMPGPPPVTGASPPSAEQLVEGALAALERDDLVQVERWLASLVELDPGHGELGFLRRRRDEERARLARGRTRVALDVLEASFDPLPDGTPWFRAGQRHALRGDWLREDAPAIRGASHLAALLAPDATDPVPAGNHYEFEARGDAALVFELRDTSPTLSSPTIGSARLPVRLADLPRGSGQLVVVREPAVAVLPPEDPNRLRRLVLRWRVTR